MYAWLFGLALLALVIAILNVDHRAASLDEQRLTRLEERIDRLKNRVDRLQQSQTGGEEQERSATSTSIGGAGVEWRLGADLSGQPLFTTAKDFDKLRGTIELLLKIQSPLPEADSWPREPGKPAPVVLRVEDATGAEVAELPMILVRGPSQEPGAYLHLRAQLPDDAADLVRLIRVDRR